MLKKRIVGLKTNRSLPQRKYQFNSHQYIQVALPGFTSLRSQKFHPYLVGLNIDHLVRDFSHSITAAYLLWKKLIDFVYVKRALIGVILASLVLLGNTGSSEARKVTFPNGAIFASNINTFQMTATIVSTLVPHFQWPFSGSIPISTNYSRWHPGIDMPQPKGTPIKPVADGQVISVENEWFGYGKNVIVAHGDDYASRYAHLSKIDVKVGDKVSTDTTIGEVGNTGHSTGNHLHMEIYSQGQTVNPVNVLPSKTDSLTTNK